MDQSEILTRLNTLKKEIHYHNYRYHTLDEPIISDYEFDQLLSELKEIEKQNPWLITPDSPSQRSGAKPLEKFEKVIHPQPILSLSNGFGAEDIIEWFNRILKLNEMVRNASFVIEPKIDGLTVVLKYENGIFIQGATRGDGLIGEDVTENLKTIASLPLRIPIDQSFKTPDTLFIRGEVYISKADFQKFNSQLESKGDKPYLNPRNTAAGSLRQLDPSITATRPLKILVYQIISSSEDLPPTQWESLDFLKRLGFPISRFNKLTSNIENAINICESEAQHKSSWPFEADGMVIKLNDLKLSDDLGFVGKDPRGAIAFKYPAEEVNTQLEKIISNVGRTGVLTPMAILKPVSIGGVVVKQATLHNFDFIKTKDIRIGDTVSVKRAGEVIPYIVGPITEIRNGTESIFSPPTQCPACGQPVENPDGGVAYYCLNNSCPAQLSRSIEHFVSKTAMDVIGLGGRIVERLISEGLIKDVADLYLLKKEDLITLDGFADKKADNLLSALKQSKNQPLNRLIFALGIQGVGEVAATMLAENFKDLDSLSKAKILDIENLEGFGPNTSKAIIDWFSMPSNIRLINKLKAVGVWPVRQSITKNNKNLPLSNLSFVITGTLPTMTRDQISSIIQSNGGIVSSGVSKNTSYLILGSEPGSKYGKAIKLDIPIIDEQGFLNLLNNQ